jgi:hypothetical protein
VKFFQQLTVEFWLDTQEKTVGSSDLPGHLALAAEGEVLYDETLPRIEPRDLPSAEIREWTAEIFQQSHPEAGEQTRMLFQNLSVVRVPVHEVNYTYRGSDVKRLWIYGTKGEVHAPGVPWRWGLLTLLIGGFVLAVGGVIAALVSAMSR